MAFPKFSTERYELLSEGVLLLFMHLYLFSTVLTSPGPAFQECTGSFHVNVPAPKVVSSQSAIDRWSQCIGPDRDMHHLGTANQIQGNYCMLVVSVIVFQLYKENLNNCVTS